MYSHNDHAKRPGRHDGGPVDEWRTEETREVEKVVRNTAADQRAVAIMLEAQARWLKQSREPEQ